VRAKGIAESAITEGMRENDVFSYSQSDDDMMQKKITSMIKSGDLVLVKGSQGSRMERISKVLLNEKIESRNALVRQESVWNMK
jgi:UDP-N-acetylmuramyl pentapeptide synthase